jgi:hypothetical protein
MDFPRNIPHTSRNSLGARLGRFIHKVYNMAPTGRYQLLDDSVQPPGAMFSLKQTKLIRPPPDIDMSQPRPGSTYYLYAVTVFVSLGAFLFGYDQGVMGVIVADQRWIDLMKPANSCRLIIHLQ